MNLQELLKTPRVETRVIPKLKDTTVYVIRIKTHEALGIGKMTDNQEAGLHLVMKCITDESGKRLFTAIDQVKDLDFDIVQALTEVVLEVNDMGKKLDDAEKNSKAPQS